MQTKKKNNINDIKKNQWLWAQKYKKSKKIKILKY